MSGCITLHFRGVSDRLLLIGHCKQPADHLTLMFAEMRVPTIENQDCAVLVTLVPGFMLDRVFERKGLALSPFARFPAHPERAAGWNDQRQMNDRPRVGDAG